MCKNSYTLIKRDEMDINPPSNFYSNLSLISYYHGTKAIPNTITIFFLHYPSSFPLTMSTQIISNKGQTIHHPTLSSRG